MKKTNDLMELVNGCGVAKSADTSKVSSAQETAALLESLGFTQAASTLKMRVNPIIKKAEISAQGYIEITPEKIQEFLNRKAKEYDRKRSSAWHPSETMDAMRSYFATYTTTSGSTAQAYEQLRNVYYGAVADPHPQGLTLGSGAYGVSVATDETFRARTVDYNNGGEIGQYVWTEVPVESDAGIPPMEVLRKFGEEKLKKVFEFFTVASVNAIKDPLLLGRIHGSGSRYFIAQWGDDVSLDDVI